MKNIWTTILGGLTFLSELVLWYGIGRVVWRQFQASNRTLAIVLGVLAAVIVVVLWAFFMAPNATRRLPVLWRIVVVSIAALVSGFLLYRAGDKVWGLGIMIGVTLIQALGQYFLSEG